MGLLGELVVKIVGDTADFIREVDKSYRKMTDFERDMKRITRAMSQAGMQLTKFVTLPIAAIGVAAIKSAADLELQQAAFETMLGSADRAKALLEDLTALASHTPFTLPDLAEGTKTLLAFGVEAEKVLPTLQMLGDISLGDSARLKQLALVYGQVTSAGRLMGQDLLQLINVGFNPLQIISEKTGETMAELKKRMEQGGISAEEVAAAFQTATSEGGMFFGGMERASTTLAGVISTLKDNVGILGRSFAEILLPSIKEMVVNLTGMVQRFSELDDGTKRTIITVAGLAAAVGPLLLLLAKLPGIITGIKAALTLLSSPPTGAIIVAVAAVVALTTAIVQLIRRKREYESLVYDTANAVRTLSQEEAKAARDRLLELQRESIARLIAATERQADAEARLADGQERLNRNIPVQARELGLLERAVVSATNITNRHQTAVDDIGKALEELDAKLSETVQELGANQEAFDETVISADEFTGGIDEATDAVITLNGWLNTLHDTIITAGWTIGEDFPKELDQTFGPDGKWQKGVKETFEGFDETFGPDGKWVKSAKEGLTAVDVVFDESYGPDGKWAKGIKDTQSRLQQFMEWYQTNYIDKIADSTQALYGAIIDLISARFDAEIAAIEASSLAEEDKEALILEIKRKEARREKALGIFNATIDTAQAIIGFLADPGGWAGVVLSVLAGITGAAQIAAVAAQPLPQMAQGGIATGPTTALIGEGGQPEMVLPLDQLGDLLSKTGNFDDVGGAGLSNVNVYIGDELIYRNLHRATRDGRLLIDTGALV